jgi:hypothetical protein
MQRPLRVQPDGPVRKAPSIGHFTTGVKSEDSAN